MGVSRTSSAEMSSFTKISLQTPLPRRPYTSYGMLLCLFILAMSLVTLLFNLTIHRTHMHHESSLHQTPSCDLQFMKAKKVVLVSHELSLSGGPLLLMELASLLVKSGAHTEWITAKHMELVVSDPAVQALEVKLKSQGVKILRMRQTETIRAVSAAHLVVLNTAVAGKWIDDVAAFKSDTSKVLAKIVWWIHEMRGHYFNLEYVKHLPNVAVVVTDSYATADYWQTRTKQRLRLDLSGFCFMHICNMEFLTMNMPKTYVVHLGNSKELMGVAEDPIARGLMRQRVRAALRLSNKDIIFSMINSVSRGKGQDLFLRAFLKAVNLVRESSVEGEALQMHALLVGSDWSAFKYETMLREFVEKNGLGRLVYFVNKSMNIAPYLAASDVLVQNSQGRGECFGRITIEAMAFKLPVLGTASGGTLEIVVNGSTGQLHPVGKEGVQTLAEHIRDLALHPSVRRRMGNRGYKRVRDHFMEHHMCEKLGHVFKDIVAQGP